MELAVYLAAFGTLRQSEICALTAENVKGNVIHVNKAVVDEGGNRWVTKGTKTVSSDKYIEIPEFVIREFPKHAHIVNLNPDKITGRFNKALKQLSIQQFRFHDLRHYSASILHTIGVPDQYIMKRGGWSSDQT